MMRVLLSSVGRRGYLVRYFKEALGAGGEVWGGDTSRYSAAFQYCDKSVVLPEVISPGYADKLIDFCQDNKINLLVPLIDPELAVLAVRRQHFFDAGLTVAVSPPETIKLSHDKFLMYKFGRETGIDMPETVLTLAEAEALFKSGRFTWPVVVKPRDGSTSSYITYCKDEEQLTAAFDNCPNPMIQEYLEGEEFGYDLFCDADYKPISVFCKRKLAMRAGETDKAVSTDDKKLIAFGLKIAENLKIFGPADVDVKTGKDGPKLLDINPRFGGGYPCSHLCGANFPAKLLSLCKGKTLVSDVGSCPAGIYMLKQDEIISASHNKLESIPGIPQKKS